VIEIQGASKSYQGREALHPITLQVPAERSLAMIGPSGCGKSTLLRLVVGLINPDKGQITIEGTPMNPGTARSLRLQMGYVIQDGGLFPHMTVAQNVTLMARQLKWERPRVDERLAHLAQLVQLPDHLLPRYPAQLSGGQRQRVGIMRALMLDPKVILMDEPMGALDPIVRASLQQDLKKIFQDLRKTVLMVTHDMGEAAFLGQEIVLMRDGSIVQKGPLEELRDQPADPFVIEFLKAQRVL
jgi:osmoprotectant transport system ATP-binding protein